jgi:hypothetical protein
MNQRNNKGWMEIHSTKNLCKHNISEVPAALVSATSRERIAKQRIKQVNMFEIGSLQNSLHFTCTQTEPGQ